MAEFPFPERPLGWATLVDPRSDRLMLVMHDARPPGAAEGYMTTPSLVLTTAAATALRDALTELLAEDEARKEPAA